jgi:hypothetical protein
MFFPLGKLDSYVIIATANVPLRAVVMRCSLTNGSFVVLARHRYEDRFQRGASSKFSTSRNLNASGCDLVIGFDCTKSHIVVIMRDLSGCIKPIV